MKKILFLLILVMFIFKLPDINSPYVSDEQFFYMPTILLFAENMHSLTPRGIPSDLMPNNAIPIIQDLGRPPLFFQLYASILLTFGKEIFILRLLSFILFSITLIYSYKLANLFLSKEQSIASTILIAVSPLVFNASIKLVPAMLVSSLFAISAYLYFKGSKWYFLFASLLAISKENASLIIIGIFLYDLIKNKTWKSIIYLAPGLTYAAWFLYRFNFITQASTFQSYWNFQSPLMEFVQSILFLLTDELRILLVIAALFYVKFKKEHLFFIIIILLYAIFRGIFPASLKHLIPAIICLSILAGYMNKKILWGITVILVIGSPFFYTGEDIMSYSSYHLHVNATQSAYNYLDTLNGPFHTNELLFYHSYNYPVLGYKTKHKLNWFEGDYPNGIVIAKETGNCQLLREFHGENEFVIRIMNCR